MKVVGLAALGVSTMYIMHVGKVEPKRSKMTCPIRQEEEERRNDKRKNKIRKYDKKIRLR